MYFHIYHLAPEVYQIKKYIAKTLGIAEEIPIDILSKHVSLRRVFHMMNFICTVCKIPPRGILKGVSL